MSGLAPASLPKWQRPIRIPESIEITHTEPPFAIAGETSSWRAPFRLSKDVPPGAELRLQLWGGRNNKGHFIGAQTERPNVEGYIAAELADGSRASLRPGEHAGEYIVAIPGDGLRKGQTLTVLLGRRAKDGPGIKICRERMLNKFFVLYVAPSGETKTAFPQWAGTSVWGKGTEDRIVAACSMHILGGAIRRLRAYAPSATRPGRTFSLLIRPEDEFGNLSHQELGDIRITVNGEALATDVERVPDSTCLQAKIALAREGVFRIRARETASGCNATANPTLCSETAQPIYWGMIHGHTEMSDGTGKLDRYFHQLRNEVMLDFAATGDHDHLWETPEALWRETCRAVKHWHDPGRFVTFLGYEWAKWRRNGDGDRNVYYLQDDRPIYRSDDGEHPSPPDLFRALKENSEKAIVIPHHTGHGGNFCDWKDHSPEHERLVEIFQVRGSYECSEQDGNPAPERVAGPPPYPGGWVQNALALGWRVGFTAGGDDHSGHWGTEFRFGMDATSYKQGLMSVQAGALTREALFQAMHDRRVVATTGARILLAYQLAGKPMGSELSIRDNPDMAAERTLSVEFHGAGPVERIEIIRNNRVAHSTAGEGRLDVSFTWTDAEPIEQTWLPPAKFSAHPFTFYYVRAVQTDGEVAWASPVWVYP